MTCFLILRISAAAGKTLVRKSHDRLAPAKLNSSAGQVEHHLYELHGSKGFISAQQRHDRGEDWQQHISENDLRSQG